MTPNRQSTQLIGAQPSVDVVQVGAREHYAVPRMLASLGYLRHLHTDAYAGRGSWLRYLQCLPNSIRARAGLRGLIERKSAIEPHHIRAHNVAGLLSSFKLRRQSTTIGRMHLHHALAQTLADRIAESPNDQPDAYLGFRGIGALFQRVKGVATCVLDQIDGGIEEVHIVRAEQEANRGWLREAPDWETCRQSGDTWWLDIEAPRLRQEWDLADSIVCNSEWTKKCLVKAGVESDKCSVIPLTFRPSQIKPTDTTQSRRPYDAPLRIAFLGTLTLRKGVHHLLEAARRASRQCNLHVELAGSLGEISQQSLDNYSDIATWHGRIPRSSVAALLERCDILALPSLSEGFGIVQLEAMAHGLPVIASDRTGDVVIDRVNGIRVPAGDIDALANNLCTLAEDGNLLAHITSGARTRAGDFDFSHVAEQWHALLSNVIPRKTTRG